MISSDRRTARIKASPASPKAVWAETSALYEKNNAHPSRRTERRRARSHSPVSLKRPLSLPVRRALPLPLPDARSPLLPEGRFQPAAALLCQFAVGTLSVPRGFHLYYITSGRASCQEDFTKESGKFCAVRCLYPILRSLYGRWEAYRLKNEAGNPGLAPYHPRRRNHRT